ncbi:hypothetical protein ABZ078_41335 [Streptomyces sp. NPDC006385]|uniref:hypothetical protein n=1 Tax=Streptomyces sp. NPDC006385 TaxID=3156761 RepID=UPI0033A3147C
MELANNDFRKAVTYTDAAAKRIEKLESVVHKATRPDDIWTPEYQILGTDPWHCDLAPAIAADRWAKVAELDQLCYDLEERWYELESEAEDIRANAAKAHADALRKGTKTPATATKSLEAYAALEGCSLALSETANELRRARGAYEALLKDRAFLEEYRTAVIAEFNAQRKRAAEAFSAAAGVINATRSRYNTLHTLTMGGLLDIPEDAQGYLVLRNKGWAQADLSSAVDVISRQVRETDPFLSGEFLTAPMDEINAKAIETAEEIKAKLYPDRQNYLAETGGVVNTGLSSYSSFK